MIENHPNWEHLRWLSIYLGVNPWDPQGKKIRQQIANAFEKALKANPKHANLHGSFGMFVMHEDTDKAIQHLQQAVGLAPKNAVWASTLADALFRGLNDLPSADQHKN